VFLGYISFNTHKKAVFVLVFLIFIYIFLLSFGNELNECSEYMSRIVYGCAHTCMLAAVYSNLFFTQRWPMGGLGDNMRHREDVET